MAHGGPMTSAFDKRGCQSSVIVEVQSGSRVVKRGKRSVENFLANELPPPESIELVVGLAAF